VAVTQTTQLTENSARAVRLFSTEWSKKANTQFYFGDNFGNSVPFFHCYKQKLMAR